MPHSYGIRARTRYMFSRKFKDHGYLKLSTYLKIYKVGDIVDVKANGAIQKVGVIIYKRVGNRYIEKRINVRIEHVKHSKCRDDFLRRVKENAIKKKDARAKGEKVNLKRQPVLPRTSRHVSTKKNIPTTITPIPYDTLYCTDEFPKEDALIDFIRHG
ncbi:18804_t:CDS:2 [Entrophospora sp. SA101]|nr:18804_t:CDS:2 [Entrophospora sp. SA101]